MKNYLWLNLQIINLLNYLKRDQWHWLLSYLPKSFQVIIYFSLWQGILEFYNITFVLKQVQNSWIFNGMGEGV